MNPLTITAVSTGSNAQASVAVPQDGLLMGVSLHLSTHGASMKPGLCAAGLRGFSDSDLAAPAGDSILAYLRAAAFEIGTATPWLIDQSRELYFPLDLPVTAGTLLWVSMSSVSQAHATAIFFFGTPLDHVVQ